jgi:transposase, IS5 family
VKLLWEACEWLWEKHIPEICKKNKLKAPRSKYKEQHNKHLVYSKLRKKSHRKTKTRRRVTLQLLLKGITEFQRILNQTKAVDLTPKDAEIFKTIKIIYQQQKPIGSAFRSITQKPKFQTEL